MRIQIYILVILSFTILLGSCVKEEYNDDSSASITFSTDSIFFDTVFTDVGSTTAYLTIHNPYDEFLKINSIGLGKGSSSQYRINVNGQSADLVRDIELGPKDSLYVLVEVTINPNSDNAPFVVQDSLVCNINGKVQDVKLMAWGQNAHYIDGRYNGHIQTTTWTADKPYLIYNSMMVDSLQTLTIEKGTKIYLHKDSYIIAKGQLDIQGTYDEPVLIQGDRLEQSYQDIPGQWGNIILSDGSGTHNIKWAEIRNGVIGIQLGGLTGAATPILNIENSKIENMNYAGLFSLASTIVAKNTLVSNCGFYGMALLAGGVYEFQHCTFANYWNYAQRTEPTVIVSNNFTTSEGQYVGDLLQADFGNCIIYGDKDNELLLSNETSVAFNYFFEKSLIKVDEDFSLEDEHFVDVIKNIDPNFVSTYALDFQLDTLSPAKDVGKLSIGQTAVIDLNNNSHIADGLPDFGAYERVE